MAKRAFDLFWALLGLALLSPVLLVIALAVKLEDRGPVFFRQVRIGKGGRPFRIWKFRTMGIDAERQGRAITVGQDPRITGLGRRLRDAKLDELPQLMNVVAGDMSLVGPRPEVPQFVAHYTEAQKAILNLRPGITDLASIKYRRESELLARSAHPDETYLQVVVPDKLRINLAYAVQASLWSDFRVILATLHLAPAPRIPGAD